VPHAREAYEKSKAAGRTSADLADRIARAEKGHIDQEKPATIADTAPEPWLTRLRIRRDSVRI
jgi:hypothetical protein